MTPVLCRVKHDPEAGTYGDCVRACVASILDMDGDAVPHFFHDNCSGEVANVRMRDWLRTVGYSPFFVNYPGEIPKRDLMSMMSDLNPDTYYILFGMVESGGDHVVVCKGGHQVHNPAWFATAMTGPGSHGLWSVMVIAKS
jgi:hypothetical protein